MRHQALFLFYRTVKEGSFSAAARKLYISQPAVSKAIKQLEVEYGQPLLARKPGGKFQVTPVGEKVFQVVQEISHQLNKLEVIKQECSRETKITIECQNISEITLISEISSKFQEKHREARFIIERVTADPIQSHFDGNCDLLMLLFPEQLPQINSNLQVIKIWEDEFKFIVPQKHPLAGKTISAAELGQLSFISATPNTAFRRILDEILKKQSVNEIKYSAELANPDSSLQSVIRLNCPGIFLRSSVDHLPDDGRFARMYVDLNMNCKHVMVHKKYVELSSALKKFIKYVQSN